MDIQRLRYFLEVARQKSFSRAAEICHVSQPSLSQQIKKLEEEVDGPLFLRSPQGIKLSALGTSFLEYAQSILASVSSAEEFIAENRSQARRTIRFGAIPTIAPYLVPRVFAALRERQSDTKLELREDRTEFITESLREGSIDFALLSPPTSIEGACDHLTLLRDELMLTMEADHPLSRARRISPGQLARETIIILGDAHCLSRQTSAYCSSLGLAPDVTIQGSQIETLLRLVELGFGMAFTPQIAVQAGHHPQLAFRRLTKLACHREVRLVWMRQSILSSTMRQTIQVLAEHFGVSKPH
jgi:LysR family hydrogen peroxide-inducible transcriptional activator